MYYYYYFLIMILFSSGYQDPLMIESDSVFLAVGGKACLLAAGEFRFHCGADDFSHVFRRMRHVHPAFEVLRDRLGAVDFDGKVLAFKEVYHFLFGKVPYMRRIAEDFKLIADGSVRLRRGSHVDEDEAAARFYDACHFMESCIRIREMMEGETGNDDIKEPVEEGDVFDKALRENNISVAFLVSLFSACFKHDGRSVHGNDRLHVRRKGAADGAGACSGFKHDVLLVRIDGCE